MTDPRPDARPDSDAETGGMTDADAAIDAAVTFWIERLLGGAELDPLEVLAEHPGIGHEVLERVESFVGIGQDAARQLERLGDFRLIRELGRGGMGVVYEAQQESLGRKVALKILPAGIAADRTAFVRFLREAQAAGKVRHAAIVEVHSLGIESDTPYYAMEYVEGATLAEAIACRRRGEPIAHDQPLIPARNDRDRGFYVAVAKAFAEVAEGLHFAHREGVVHRDIKPSNLMVDTGGVLRILDFGLAYVENMGSLTMTGELVGTPLYMSPEQARRETVPVDHRTDIYSLGATMYEVLSLEPPYRGKDRHDILRRIVEDDPPPLRAHDPFVPRDLETIVSKSMRRAPGGRYATAQALSQDLARFVKGEPIEAKPEGPWTRAYRKIRRRRWSITAALALLAALAAVAWLALARSRAEHERELALYPQRLQQAVGKLDSGSWVLRAAWRPLSAPGIDFPVFAASDFRELTDLGGQPVVREAIGELELLTRSLPEMPEPYFHLARAHLVYEDKGLAIDWLDRALEVDTGYLPAADLRERLTAERKIESSSRRPWLTLWRDAHARRGKDRIGAEGALTRLIDLLETSEPPYTGFLTECYLQRAAVRLELDRYDLAQEDCVRARTHNPELHSSVLLLGKIYLEAGRTELARHAFARLQERFEHLAVLPFWFVSVYLSIHEPDPENALEWARTVEDPALRERLLTYLHLRMGQWSAAARASRRAIAVDTDGAAGLVPRQLLATALIEHVRETSDIDSLDELASACRSIVEIDPTDRRSRYLLRAGWDTLLRLRMRDDDEGAVAGRSLDGLRTTAALIGLDLPEDPRAGLVEDFSDASLDDGRPLRWRVVDECCPANVVATAVGLTVSKPDPGLHPGWLVTEELFSDDVSLRLRADVGEAKVCSNLHVDLGTTSLYFGCVSRDGQCEIGELAYGRVARWYSAHIDPLPDDVDVVFELSSIGDAIELRVWLEGAERPEAPTLEMDGAERRLGAIGLSSESRPAMVREVRVEPRDGPRDEPRG